MEPILTELIKLGTAGLFLAFLVYKNTQLEKANQEKDGLIKQLYELRVSEANAASAVEAELAESQDKVAEALDAIGGRLASLESSVAKRRQQ